MFILNEVWNSDHYLPAIPSKRKLIGLGLIMVGNGGNFLFISVFCMIYASFSYSKYNDIIIN
ncbi:hypothetical protein AYY26_18995 [Photobacterium phosphoreum]|nr:hypothetical protein AYY25_18945 [Photobacterium phosphoreum]OBU43104.1 hypothetical protein AYY26_18995 [Photobacterium phosphoreum]